MSGSNVLAAKDVNTSMPSAQDALESNGKTDVRSMEYHRQVLQSKMEHETKQYISPSDNIMSPCTAKLSALRNKQVGKAKPKSLFAKASAKKLEGDNVFGSQPKSTTPTSGLE